MKKAQEIKKDFYWVGAIDWNLRDFHGYSTEKGSTYNSFLLMDEKVTLFDTVKAPFSNELLERISDIVDPSKIDYIVINHVEMDHSGSLPLVIDKIKPEKIFCSAKGKKAIENHFDLKNLPIHVVKSGDTINVGKKNIEFLETPMLHWPDSMFTYIKEDKILISSDAFGQHFATSKRFDDEVDLTELTFQAAKYYANILLPYSPLIVKLLKAVTDMGLEIDMIAPDHGLIWRKNISKIIDLYSKWGSGSNIKKKAVLFYDTMWNSTQMLMREVSEGLISKGIETIFMKLGDTDRSDVMTEILDAKAIVVGSATLNNEMLPRVADMLTYMKGLKTSGRIGFAVNSYGWNKKVLEKLNEEMKASKVDLISEGISVNYRPTKEDLNLAFKMGQDLAKNL